MDAPIRLPEILSTRPKASKSASHGQGCIHQFDIEQQRAPDCAGFGGVFVLTDFFSEAEASRLLREIEGTPFRLGQSGKQKQHYGTKINFKKRKINSSKFRGLPRFARLIETRLRDLIEDEIQNQVCATDRFSLDAALANFETTDVFVLQYQAQDQSNLDFHRDDTFAYGETILDVSLESDSVLTFLDRRHTDAQPSHLDCVRVPLPARSLAVVFGSARFDWDHAILPYDILGRRTSITLRTLSDTLRASEAGNQILEIARGDLIDAEDPEDAASI
jgi:alkylated DNA repair protein alkB family protein 4